MPRPRSRRPRTALAAGTALLAALALPLPAAPQTVFQLEGAANLGYEETTGSVPASRLYAEARPALALQFGSPRLAWRAGYAFAGSLTLDGEGPSTYSNSLTLALAAQPTSRSTITVNAGAAQGSTAFQLSQRTLDASQPGFRAPGNPDLVTATLGQAFAWEATPSLRVRQGLTGSLSAPQHAFDRYNLSANASLGLDRVFPRDAVGLQVRSGFALLSAQDGEHYKSIDNALLGSWNHDFDETWNGHVTAGVEQVLTFAGSYPLAIAPTGSLAAQVRAGGASAALSYTHGAATDLQTGTVSVNDTVTLRGVVSFDPVVPRVLGASAGFVHARPLGEAASRAAAGTGNALQGDVRLAWELREPVLATATYSLAYQYGQSGGLPPSLVQVFLVGITVRYSSAPYTPPMPTLGGRVDGSDAVPFSGGSAPGP